MSGLNIDFNSGGDGSVIVEGSSYDLFVTCEFYPKDIRKNNEDDYFVVETNYDDPTVIVEKSTDDEATMVYNQDNWILNIPEKAYEELYAFTMEILNAK